MVTQQVSAVVKSVFHVLVVITVMDLVYQLQLDCVMLVFIVDLGHLCLHQLMVLLETYVQGEDIVLKDQLFKQIAH